MRVDGGTIIFHSEDRYYNKELYGRKPNTVRHITDPVELKAFAEWEAKPYRYIKIIASGGRRNFERKVTDVSHFDIGVYNLVIISWEPVKLEE
jgi:hypothetical protein